MEQSVYYHHLGLLHISLFSIGILKKVFLYSFIASTFIAGIILIPIKPKKKSFVMPVNNSMVVDSFSKVMNKVSYQINIINNVLPDKK